MGTPRLYKFYMQDANGNYYYRDSNNEVQTTTTKTALKNSPFNWEQIKIQFGRDEARFGIFRTAAIPIEFHSDGAAILKHIYNGNGRINFEAYCKFTIERRNDGATNIWQHLPFYSAEVDFANEFSIGKGENGKDLVEFVKARLVETGLPEIIKSRMDTPFEIQLSGSKAKTINLDGVELQGNYSWVVGDLNASGGVSIQNMGTGAAQGYVVPMALSAKEGDEYFKDIYVFTSQGHEVFLLNNTPTDTNKFLYADQQLDATYSLTATIDAIPSVASTTINVVLVKKDFAANTFTTTTLYTSAAFSTLTQFSISVSGSHTFNPDLFGYFLVVRAAGGVGDTDITIRSLNFGLTFKERLPATTTVGMRYDDFMEELVRKVTDNQYGVNSVFLTTDSSIADLNKFGRYNNLPRYTYVTSGTALRGIAGATIKTTLGEALQDMWARWMVGISTINNEVRVETIDKFFNKNEVIARLGSATVTSRTTATEWIYNQLKCGYPDQNIDRLNGRYERNAQVTYKLPIKKIDGEMDLISLYRADVYGIEYVRSALFGKNTTNNEGDNSTYLLEVSGTVTNGGFDLLRYASPDVISGVPSSATLYNVGLSPDRFPLRHIPYLRSIFDFPDGLSTSQNFITFQTGTKLTDSYTYIGGKLIKIDNNVLPGFNYDGTLKPKIFIPQIINVVAQPDEDLLSLMAQTPFGVIEFFNGDGDLESGFVLDAGINTGTKETYQFRLLKSPPTS